MKNKWKERSGEVIGWLLVFVLIMITVGILLDSRLRDLLNIYLERQVALQAHVLAENVNEKLNSELRMLEGISNYIEQETDQKEAALQMLMLEDEGTSAGMLDVSGKAVCGEQLSLKEFPGIHESIHGHNGICYNREHGLLFTVPVYHGENIQYILYKLFPKEILIERFAVTSYGEEGKIAVCDRDGRLVVPIPNWTEEEHLMFESREILEVLEAVKREMVVESSAAKLVSYQDKNWFIFVAEIGQTDFNLTGAVSKELLSEGIDYIVTLVIWVFGLLLVLLLIGIIYLLVVEGKARESDELREAKQLAEQENRAKSEFLAKMSHEIRTPINAVMGMNEMILRESSEAEIRKYAWNIRNASRNLLEIINDILDFSKIESGKMELVEQKYSMGILLRDVINLIYVRAQEKELELLTKIDETLPDQVLGDEMKVRQILTNILSNAVKYTKTGNVSLEVSGNREKGRQIYCISVTDTGIGIREEDKERLFDDFERLDREKNQDIEGTGLGLAITHRLLEQMGGRLEVESVYGEGSVFTIYLPQQVMGEQCIGDLRKRFAEQEKGISGNYGNFVAPEAKVLVVDDTEVNLLVVKGLLKNTEIQVSTCKSGAECLALVQKQRYDVILLDHMMPEMDGIETLKRMKAMENNLCKDTPVIVLTANALVGVREQYIQEGFDDYLSKPVEGQTLELMIQKYLPDSKITAVHQEFLGNQAETVKTKVEEAEKSARTEKEDEKTMINRAVGLEYCGGMEDIYQEVLESYYEVGQEYSEKMPEYVQNQDWSNYTVIVHAIKSTSLTIGATQLSEAAKEQEMAAKAGDVETIAAKWEAVHRAYLEVLQEVKNMIAEEK